MVICADDHAAYVSGAYGNPIVRTPAIDSLARQGMCFLRAYCNSPVCTASRQSFLTGRYPRTIGVTRLQTALGDRETTLAEMLRQAGYATAAIGKMHFNSSLAHGFDVRIDLPDYQHWLAEQRREPVPAGVAVQGPWRPFRDPASVWLNSDCRPIGLSDALMHGSYFAARAGEFLRQAKGPFFLMVSFYEPHSPFQFPLEFRGRHSPGEFAVPTVGPEDDSQIPEIFRPLDARQKQGIAAAYATSVEFLDKNVAAVLAAVEQSGLANNTLVVYLGDHGYMLGQHGRFEKHTSYEPAIRTPLVMRLPGRISPGGRSAALVELIDVAPTICELCDVPAAAGVQGRSLAALLAGKTDEHREHVVVEYAPNDEAMIRDQRWKLVYERGAARRTDGYDTGRPLVPRHTRLYDLTADSDEMHNVANEPANAATVRRLTDLLVEHLVRTAREPALIPQGVSQAQLLDFLVQSRDVEPSRN